MALAAPAETREPREAHRLDEAALGRWLEANVKGCRGGAVTVRQFKGGQSNPTYWVGVSGGEGGDVQLVVRKKPPGTLLPSAHAVEREYRIMSALGATDVPVPETLGASEDASVIGTPFFVMRYVTGRVFWDPALPQVTSPEERGAIHRAYIEALAKLHSVDPAKVGLGDYGKVGGYVARQVERWSSQYEASRTSEIPAMEALLAWIRRSVPATDETTLIHGDYRIDNLIVAQGAPKALAIIDWELSTLGHPLSDVAYACMAYHMNMPGRGGLAGVDVAALGIPTEQEQLARYCALTGRAGVEDFDFFMAFGIFRLAAIAQGVYKRSLQGNASSDSAGQYGAAVGMLAELGCNIAGIATSSSTSKQQA
ncbi:MAG: hypothetical protein JWP97_5059 [Labilithrix sp.]|nr:hypothetical protein [Labilithrix sp.]